MTDSFTCTNCRKERPADLHDSGKRKPRCKVCEAHRKHVAKARQPMELAEFEADYFDRRALAAQGLRRCASCSEAKPKEGKWRGSQCWPCHLERMREWKRENRPPEARLDEYLKQNRRRGCETYGSRHKKAAAYRKARNKRRLSRVKHESHVGMFYRWLKTDAPFVVVEEHYARQGKPWNNPRLSWAEKWRLRYQEDERFAAAERMRASVRRAIRRQAIGDLMRQAIYRGGRSRVVEGCLGYTIEDLCQHLEKQFTRGMSWKRFRSGEIHIDHITPVAAFDLSDTEQWEACWCLSNLRPCWASDNLRKGSRREFLL